MVVTSISKIVERKVAVIKTLEDKTTDICENEEQLEQHLTISRISNEKLLHQHRSKGTK